MKNKIISIYLCMILITTFLVTTVSANEPPSTPSIDGPTNGKAGVEYTYEICSSDPDEDEILICVDWGDGSGEVCYGPYTSGTCVKKTHSWSGEGQYTIKAKARDTNEAESEWATLEISMPKIKSNTNTPFLNFLENHPLLFQLLHKLFGLK